MGLTAGSCGGWIDLLLMRLTDVFLALPALPVLLILAAVDLEKPLSALQDTLGRSEWDLPGLAHASWLHAVRLVLVMALFSWMGTARLVRAQVLSIKEREFVLAARATGVGDGQIFIRHLLPHAMPSLIVMPLLTIMLSPNSTPFDSIILNSAKLVC